MKNEREVGSARESMKVHDFLETVLLMALFVIAFTGLLFGLRYESYNPLVGSFSGRYLIACLGPAVAVVVAICALLMRPQWRRPVPKGGVRFAAPAVVAVAVPVVAGVFVWTSNVPESRLALALGVTVPVLGILVAARLSTRPQLLLCCMPVVGLVAVLLLAEVPLLMRPDPVRWGDRELFAFMHPTEPPFMGPGGRLRPEVHRDQMSAEFPRGATVITNRDGFRNLRDFDGPPGDETRVLSLGDSFSTGYAMPQELFFGAQVERAARELMPHRNIVVLNAEVSNPAHGLFYLQKYGRRSHPRMVLFGLSGNDLVQTEHFFGPDALFTGDGAGGLIRNPAFDSTRKSPIVRYRDFVYPATAPASRSPHLAALRRACDRWLAHIGRLSLFSLFRSRVGAPSRPVPMFSYAQDLERKDSRKRLVDGLADLGLYYPAGAETVEPLYQSFFLVLEGLRRASEAAGAEFVLVIFPQRFQLQPQDWEVMCERWSLDPAHFDLTLANRRIGAECAEAGIRCIDLLAPMRERAAGRELYLPGGDMHFNSTGCRLAGELAAAAVERALSQEHSTEGSLDEGGDSR